MQSMGADRKSIKKYRRKWWILTKRVSLKREAKALNNDIAYSCFSLYKSIRRFFEKLLCINAKYKNVLDIWILDSSLVATTRNRLPSCILPNVSFFITSI